MSLFKNVFLNEMCIFRRLESVCPSNGSLFTEACWEQLEGSFPLSTGL